MAVPSRLLWNHGEMEREGGETVSKPPSPHPFKKYRKRALASRHLSRGSWPGILLGSKYESLLIAESTGEAVVIDLCVERASWWRVVLKLEE
jgi:hypothetical protein